MASDEACGYDCEFEKKKPEETDTYCPICHQILREPVQMKCCGKVYCMACIMKAFRSKKICPTCKKSNPKYFPDKRIKQSLSGFRVHCIHYNKEGQAERRGGGCDWVGELGDLERHLNKNPPEDTKMNGCLYIEVKCKFCGTPFQRSLTEDHQTNRCSKRPYSCPHCQYNSTYIEITEIHIQICPCFPTDCPHCSDVLEQQHIELHINNDCPLAPVACDFFLVGCQEQLPRAQMKTHIQKNGVCHAQMLSEYAKDHSDERVKQYLPMLTICLETLTTLNKSHMEVISTLRTQNEEHEEEISTLRTQKENLVKELSTRNRDQTKKISSIITQNKAQREEISTLKRMNQTLMGRISTLRIQNEEHDEEISSLQTQNEEHEEKILTLRRQNKACMMEIVTLQIEKEDHMEDKATLRSQNRANMEEISTLRIQNEEHEEEISTLRTQKRAHIIALQIEKEDHMEERASLRSQIKTHMDDKATLRSQNRAHKEKISTLKTVICILCVILGIIILGPCCLILIIIASKP